jgi:hypothetical protein
MSQETGEIKQEESVAEKQIPTTGEEVEESKESEKKETIKRVGQILNEDGEWEEYVEEEEVNKPPIAYTYMGGDICPIEDDSEVVDFCM